MVFFRKSYIWMTQITKCRRIYIYIYVKYVRHKYGTEANVTSVHHFRSCPLRFCFPNLYPGNRSLGLSDLRMPCVRYIRGGPSLLYSSPNMYSPWSWDEWRTAESVLEWPWPWPISSIGILCWSPRAAPGGECNWFRLALSRTLNTIYRRNILHTAEHTTAAPAINSACGTEGRGSFIARYFLAKSFITRDSRTPKKEKIVIMTDFLSYETVEGILIYEYLRWNYSLLRAFY